MERMTAYGSRFETAATVAKEETGGMVLGMASVFHTLVFRIALIRVGRRASPAFAKASASWNGSKRSADPLDRGNATGL